MRVVNLVITVREDGTATVEIPHDKNQQKDAAAAASLTDKIAKALGDVVERHIGDHEHHDHEHHHHHLRTGGTQ